ncbi:MAG TPA: NUDIX domain-containing protein [Lutibacter sp.]|nr:NUDIX domain-containing protein [Lutibacter sp.]
MYTIFVNNKPIILSDEIEEERDFEICAYSELQIEEVLHKLKNTKATGFYIYHEDLDLLWRKIKNFFKLVKAAGGVVIKENEILMIYRNDFWDLPKGKMEKGETKEETALREVEEECSIQDLKIKKKLPTTYHVFYEDNKYKLKITYWYTMTTKDDSNPIPQKEEGITKAEFIPIKSIPNHYAEMYRSIQELLKNNILKSNI